MNSRTQIAEILLSIQNDRPDHLMDILSGSPELWAQKAVLYSIENKKPQILEKVMTQYPASANFTFVKTFTGCSLSQTVTRFNNVDDQRNTCPLLYAISKQEWHCAIKVAKRISQSSLGNAKYVSNGTHRSNSVAFQAAMLAKQYKLMEILLSTKSNEININAFLFMDHAIKQQDQELIMIGLKHGANYTNQNASHALFQSVWNEYLDKFYSVQKNKPQMSDILLSIQNDREDLLMEVLSGSPELWAQKAVLYSIENKKPQILDKVMTQYPASANFTFVKTFTGCSLSQTVTRFNNVDDQRNTCPLLYAISKQEWNCAIKVAKRISQSSLGNAEYVSNGTHRSNAEAFQSAMLAKKYELMEILLSTACNKVNINAFLFMDHAIKQQDQELIMIGLKHGANYTNQNASHALFQSVWNECQDILLSRDWFITYYRLLHFTSGNVFQMLIPEIVTKLYKTQVAVVTHPSKKIYDRLDQRSYNIMNFFNFKPHTYTKIVNIDRFVDDYDKLISLTARFLTALDMRDLVDKMKTILETKNISAPDKVKEIDSEISNFLRGSALRVASKELSLDDFNWQVKVLGERVWVGGYKQYNLLNKTHEAYIDGVRTQAERTKQTYLIKSNGMR